MTAACLGCTSLGGARERAELQRQHPYSCAVGVLPTFMKGFYSCIQVCFLPSKKAILCLHLQKRRTLGYNRVALVREGNFFFFLSPSTGRKTSSLTTSELIYVIVLKSCTTVLPSRALIV